MIGAPPCRHPFAENEYMSISTLRGCRSVAAAIATVVITHGTTLAQEPTKDPATAGAQPPNADNKAPDDAVTLPVVHVHGKQPPPNRTVLNPTIDHLFPAVDAADVLQSIPGVSLGRIGGHGGEPYIRGQSQTRINIIDDGAFIHGGCPNRMDPPTAYLSVDGIDSLIVDKGYATVTSGPGGPGGTVRATRKSPVFLGDKS